MRNGLSTIIIALYVIPFLIVTNGFRPVRTALRSSSKKVQFSSVFKRREHQSVEKRIKARHSTKLSVTCHFDAVPAIMTLGSTTSLLPDTTITTSLMYPVGAFGLGDLLIHGPGYLLMPMGAAITIAATAVVLAILLNNPVSELPDPDDQYYIDDDDLSAF